MFFENSISKFHIFQVEAGLSALRGRSYVFLEDTSDIAGTDLFPYENYVEPILTGQVVKIVTVDDGRSPFLELTYSKLFIEMLNISVHQSHETHHGAMAKFWNWECDIVVLAILGGSQMNVFLASNTDYLRIWIKGIQYTSPQFYFLKTFTLQLWICYLSAFLFCIMLCWGFKKCFERCLPTSRYISIEVFNFISLLLDQGGDSSGQSALSLKFILITYLGLLIIFFGSFDSLLSVLLAINKINLPFDDLDGMLQQPDYVVCTWMQSGLDDDVRNYSQGLYDTLAKINDPNYCPHATESFLQHYDSNFTCEYEKIAFIDYPSGASELRSKCDLSVPLKGKYFTRYRSFYVNSGFRYKQQFNVLIVKIKSSGIDYVLRQRYFFGPKMQQSTEQNIVPIDLNHISLISYIFILGSVCAFLILLFEILYAKIMKQK